MTILRLFGFSEDLADNAWKVAGFVPLVGCVAAIKHWKQAYDCGQINNTVDLVTNSVTERGPFGASDSRRILQLRAAERKMERICLIVRGIFEFLGLGILVGLLLDLPASCCIQQRV